MIASILNGLTLENQRPKEFLQKICCLLFLSRILNYINIHLFKANNFFISKIREHVSKCKKCDKRFAKKMSGGIL